MERTTNIPYRSQWDADANQRRNDCGPACVAMVLQAFGQYVDINTLSLIDVGDDGTTAAELIALLARRGIEAKQTGTPTAPAICLVKYSGFKRAGVQDVNFTGWHWLILLGGDEGGVITHDPDWWGVRRSEGAAQNHHKRERAQRPRTIEIERHVYLHEKNKKRPVSFMRLAA